MGTACRARTVRALRQRIHAEGERVPQITYRDGSRAALLKGSRDRGYLLIVDEDGVASAMVGPWTAIEASYAHLVAVATSLEAAVVASREGI